MSTRPKCIVAPRAWGGGGANGAQLPLIRCVIDPVAPHINTVGRALIRPRTTPERRTDRHWDAFRVVHECYIEPLGHPRARTVSEPRSSPLEKFNVDTVEFVC